MALMRTYDLPKPYLSLANYEMFAGTYYPIMDGVGKTRQNYWVKYIVGETCVPLMYYPYLRTQ